MIQLPPACALQAQDIVRAVERAYALPTGSLAKKYGKPEPICSARQLAMCLVRRHTAYSFPKIGRLFGGFHHTTVMHGIRMAEECIAEKPEFQIIADRIADEARQIAEVRRRHPEVVA